MCGLETAGREAGVTLPRGGSTAQEEGTRSADYSYTSPRNAHHRVQSVRVRAESKESRSPRLVGSQTLNLTSRLAESWTRL